MSHRGRGPKEAPWWAEVWKQPERRDLIQSRVWDDIWSEALDEWFEAREKAEAEDGGTE